MFILPKAQTLQITFKFLSPHRIHQRKHYFKKWPMISTRRKAFQESGAFQSAAKFCILSHAQVMCFAALSANLLCCGYSIDLCLD